MLACPKPISRVYEKPYRCIFCTNIFLPLHLSSTAYKLSFNMYINGFRVLVGMSESKNFTYKSLQTAEYCGVSGIVTAHYIEL